MPKYVKCVSEMVEKVVSGKHNYAEINRYGRTVYSCSKFNENGKEFIEFTHYGTITMYYNLTDGVIEKFGGFSATDRDSLNNVLNVVKYQGRQYFTIAGGYLHLYDY